MFRDALNQLTAVKDTHGDQAAYHGHLLYTFADDHPGQVTGQGVEDFFVATPASPPSPATQPPPPPPQPPTSSSYGF